MGRRIGHSRSNPSTPLVSATLNVWTLARSLVMLYNSSSWNEKHPVWTNTKDLYPVPLCLVNIVSSILDFQYSLAMHLPLFTKKKKKIHEFVEKSVVFFVIFLRIAGRIWKNSDTMYSRNQVCACVRVTFFVVLIEKKRGNNMSKTKKKEYCNHH